MLRSPDFDVDKIDGITDGEVLTFIDKLHDVTENSTLSVGTSETHTDSLVDDLLRIARLNTWPLKIKLVLGKFHSYDDYVFLKFASLNLEFTNHTRSIIFGVGPVYRPNIGRSSLNKKRLMLTPAF